MCRGRSPARFEIRLARSRPLRAGPCFSMSSATFPWRCNRNSCGSFRTLLRARGRNADSHSNVRILAATNRDLEKEIAAGRFREDLFYRLNVIEITVPPLRQRSDDILPLAGHLLQFFAKQNGKRISGFSEPARQAICKYPWPGNVRRAAQRHRAGSHSDGRIDDYRRKSSGRKSWAANSCLDARFDDA